MSKKLVWDAVGDRCFETGLSKGVLYPLNTTTTPAAYDSGVAWNGLTGVTESPSGAELTDLYADDIVYASLRSGEKFGGTIEAYMYPPEFEACNGEASPVTGAKIGQQKRAVFGMAYNTIIGDDTDPEKGYKIHLVYGATVSPSERAYATINESPAAVDLSWEFNCVPVPVNGHKPTSTFEISSITTTPTKMAALEAILYGTEMVEPRLPMPDEIIALLTAP